MKAPMDDVMAAYGGRDDVLLEAHIGRRPAQLDRHTPLRKRPCWKSPAATAPSSGCCNGALRHGYHPAVIGSSDVHLPTLGRADGGPLLPGTLQQRG